MARHRSPIIGLSVAIALALLVALLVGMWLGSEAQAEPDKMYWTDLSMKKIQRANLDGSGVEDLVTVDRPRHIALDEAGGEMYWTDQGTNKIQRANLDGSGLEDLVTTGLSAPNGIALDVAGGKMYWGDVITDKIQRANLDGSGVEDLVMTDGPGGIALDWAAERKGLSESICLPSRYFPRLDFRRRLVRN